MKKIILITLTVISLFSCTEENYYSIEETTYARMLYDGVSQITENSAVVRARVEFKGESFEKK